MAPAPLPEPLDSFLPAQWDVHADLAVLFGAGHGGTVNELVARGQQRVVLHLAPGETAPALPAPAAVTRTRPELLQAILNFPEPLPRQVILRRAPGTPVDDDELRALGTKIAECLRSKELLHATVEQQGAPNALRTLENLQHVAGLPSTDALRGAFTRVPAVIVSPGPSLSKNVHLLERLKGHALLLTGTHSLSVFERVGVAPDLVLAADAGDLERHYGSFDERTIEALLVSVACRADQFLRRAPRRFTFAGNPECDGWVFEPLDEDAGLPTGGSVACSALSLAVQLGCDPIVLVGQDLAFEGGRYYARECTDGEARVEESGAGFQVLKPAGDDSLEGMTTLGDGRKVFAVARESVRVPGYHGGEVPSSRAFLAFKFWFESVIESLGGSPRVWNCTEGGAHIAGARQLTLEAALPRLTASPLDAGAVLDACTRGFDPEERRARLREHFDGLVQGLELALERAASCQRAVRQASRGGAALQRLEEQEACLRESLAPLRLLSVVGQREIALAVDRARRATDLRANLAAAASLFEVIERNARLLQEPVREARDRLRA